VITPYRDGPLVVRGLTRFTAPGGAEDRQRHLTVAPPPPR